MVDLERLTRTILYDLEGARGAPDDWPPAQAISASKVLTIDHFGILGMIRAAKIARGTGVPVVADFESSDRPEFPQLLALVDHLIVSQEFAAELTGLTTPAAIVNALWTNERATVAITKGGEGCWFRTREDRAQVRHQPAFRVQIVDTTGCGDVFHGAYASALARGAGASERIQFASAAAALKATQPGGQSGIPGRQSVEAFLRENGT
jgi:sugar/nucleoside kinase (ribokinase family)